MGNCEIRNGTIICSRRSPRLPPCKFCLANTGMFVQAPFLCDYPMGDGKTCDAACCEQHAVEIGPNVHYCAEHKGEGRLF